MDHVELAGLRARLENMLQARLSKSESCLRTMSETGDSPADAMDRAAMETQRHLDLLMRGLDLTEIRQIRQALERIRAGEYGICRECGEDIDIRRLRARPMVDLCVTCMNAEEIEQSRQLLLAREVRCQTRRDATERPAALAEAGC